MTAAAISRVRHAARVGSVAEVWGWEFRSVIGFWGGLPRGRREDKEFRWIARGRVGKREAIRRQIEIGAGGPPPESVVQTPIQLEVLNG